MRPLFLWLVVFQLAATTLVSSELLAANAAATGDNPNARASVTAMKASPRGPFDAIVWYCRDGTELPPRPSACREHGGGVQHGRLSSQARALRAAGYFIANHLADLDPAPWIGARSDLRSLKDALIELFLVQADDGWIFRGARTYRGAFQAEDEEAGAARILAALVADKAWLTTSRYLLVREAARLFPAVADTRSTTLRQLAARIAEADPKFAPLRAKIHGLPDAGDAGRVRDYASKSGSSKQQALYAQLANEIESFYDIARSARTLSEIARSTRAAALTEDLAPVLEKLVAAQDDPRTRLTIAANAMARLRDQFTEYPSSARVAALRSSLLLERIAFAASSELRTTATTSSRRWSAQLLRDVVQTLYGSGLISSRQARAAVGALARLTSTPTIDLRSYRDDLRWLARVAGWASRSLEYHFEDRIKRLSEIEPVAREFIPDRLRGSLVLLWSHLVDVLQHDAATLAGTRHVLFGNPVAGGLRALNPGLTRGVLRSRRGDEGFDQFASDGIYLLPDTVSDLPPVAGILTRGAGSSLSHLQLLARNLGIPNVVVDEAHIPTIERHIDQRVVLASSPQGLVELAEDDARWVEIFGRTQADDQIRIQPDLVKLDLATWQPIPLTAIRATDSGRIAGPKAANLGELAHIYGDAVPRGVVVPFGAFRRLLDRPLRSGGPPVFTWMRQNYAALRDEPDADRRRAATGTFLGELRSWIENAKPDPELEAELARVMATTLGKDGTYGVFVRSDTNVEDLPGFTGAGLNLTVPNVVGLKNIMTALHRVWASPFSDRSYAWRQSLMDDPENVYPGVVLLESFPSEKSGVLVTVDVDTGDAGWLSIATSEGVGGAVEGQAAEELRVRTDGSVVKLLSQASATTKASLAAAGGVEVVATSDSDTILQPEEIAQLVTLAADVPNRFEALRNVAADVEFGFRDGELALLQVRPFVESKRASRSLYLQRMDRQLTASNNKIIDLEKALLRGPED